MRAFLIITLAYNEAGLGPDTEAIIYHEPFELMRRVVASLASMARATARNHAPGRHRAMACRREPDESPSLSHRKRSPDTHPVLVEIEICSERRYVVTILSTNQFSRAADPTAEGGYYN